MKAVHRWLFSPIEDQQVYMSGRTSLEMIRAPDTPPATENMARYLGRAIVHRRVFLLRSRQISRPALGGLLLLPHFPAERGAIFFLV